MDFANLTKRALPLEQNARYLTDRLRQSMFAGLFAAADPTELVDGPVMIANFIILSFILVEVVGFAMQLYYYRRGF